MLRIGLTGGLASGKTTVAQIFARLGLPVLDADRIGHDFLRPGSACLPELETAFGREILGRDGVQRERLAQLVFNDPAAREKLQAILHPRIQRRLHEEFLRLEQAGGHWAAVAEVVLLLENRLDGEFDGVIAVIADPESQIKRFQERRGVSRAAAAARMRWQTDNQERRRRAGFVIENFGARADLEAQALRAYEWMKSLS